MRDETIFEAALEFIKMCLVAAGFIAVMLWIAGLL
jgi:hypothetical protein